MEGLNASQELQTSGQYNALTSLITDDSADVGKVLEDFCEPVESNPSELEGELAMAWQSIIAMAADITWASPALQKLVDLVENLQSRPDLKKDGKPCEVEGMVVWKDLPTFGWQMRSAWNHAAADDTDHKHQLQWTNLNAFTAKLVAAAHAKAQDQPDFSLYGIWTIRQALEESEAPSNTTLSAAAVWFSAAAPTIKDFCRKDKSFEGKVAKPGPAWKDQKWTGYTQERWDLWVQRFGELEDDVTDDATKQLVQEARKAIDAVAK